MLGSGSSQFTATSTIEALLYERTLLELEQPQGGERPSGSFLESSTHCVASPASAWIEIRCPAALDVCNSRLIHLCCVYIPLEAMCSREGDFEMKLMRKSSEDVRGGERVRGSRRESWRAEG
jgi:hypothetical protein